MIRVWHHGAWNRNHGDWVLHESIQHHLRRATKRSISFAAVDSQKTRYDQPLIDRLNREADALLVGGGGLVFHRPEDGSISGWQWNIRLEDLDRVRVPIIVYGIGYNRFPFDPNSDTGVLAEHLRAVQEKAAIFSVRNTGSRAALAGLGLAPGRIRVVPDAGIFAPWHPLAERELLPPGPVVGWNFAGDRPRHRYPEPALEREAFCVEQTAQAVGMLCDEIGGSLLLIPHLSTIDERADEAIRRIVGKQRVFKLPDVAPQLYPPRPEAARGLVGAYAACDVVIGMRGHACMIPFGVETPFIALSTHAKSQFFLRDVELDRLAVRPEDLWTGRTSAEELRDRLMFAYQSRAIAAAMAQSRRSQQREFDAFNRDVARLLTGSRSLPLERHDEVHNRRS